MLISGKIGLVTGAAQGLGKAIAEALLKNGATVILSDVSSEKGQETLATLQKIYGKTKVDFIQCDVTLQTQMEDMFRVISEKYDGLDIMCNNAGIGGEDDNTWEKTVDINVKGTIRGTRLSTSLMRKGGVIVNMASMAGLNPNPFGPVYCATKHAIVGFSRSWAMSPNCVQKEIRVNILCPAFVDTPLLASLVSGSDDTGSGSAVRDFINKIGVMTPEFVAEGFIDLVEDDTKNGAVLKMAKTSGKVYHEY